MSSRGDYCMDLRLRLDSGHCSGEYKQITTIDCQAKLENRPCTNSGNCIIRISDQTNKKVTSKDVL